MDARRAAAGGALGGAHRRVLGRGAELVVRAGHALEGAVVDEREVPGDHEPRLARHVRRVRSLRPPPALPLRLLAVVNLLPWGLPVARGAGLNILCSRVSFSLLRKPEGEQLR